MATIDLVLKGKAFSVPRASISTFLERHSTLVDAPSYSVQSSVPPAVFQSVVASLINQAELLVTKDNFGPLSVLAHELRLVDLASECTAFSVDFVSKLGQRVWRVERQLSTLLNPATRADEQLAVHERQLETLSSGLTALPREIASLRIDCGAMKSEFRSEIDELKGSLQDMRSEARGLQRVEVEGLDRTSVSLGAMASPGPKSLSPATSNSPPQADSPKSEGLTQVEIPMKAAKSLDGIISYLTRKHGGNVHERGIVTITSNSGESTNDYYVLKNVADLTSTSYFWSEALRGVWVCWDFRERRVRLTHYTMWCDDMKSWVLEGSSAGTSWQIIDERTDNEDFKSHHKASFAVANGLDCCFIRLTMKDDHGDHHQFIAKGIEFFGSLFE